MPSIWVFLFKKILSVYFFLAVLSLHCRSGAFSSCYEQGLLFVAARRLLTAVASLVAERRFQSPLAPAVVALGSRAQAQQSGAQTWFLGGMWDLLGSRLEPVSLALAGRFLTFGPPGESSDCVYFQLWYTSTFSRLNTISGCVLYVKRSKDNIIFYDTNTFLILTTLN